MHSKPHMCSEAAQHTATVVLLERLGRVARRSTFLSTVSAGVRASAALEFFVVFDGAGAANGSKGRCCRFNCAPALRARRSCCDSRCSDIDAIPLRPIANRYQLAPLWDPALLTRPSPKAWARPLTLPPAPQNHAEPHL